MDKLPAESAGNQSLGTDCQDCGQHPESGKERRYRLQSVAARLLPSEKVSSCHRALAPGQQFVPVMYDGETGSAYYRNLMCCDRVWLCPVCAEKISRARREEISAALIRARQLGLTPVLVTYTVRHDVRSSLSNLLSGLLESLRDLKAHRGFKELRSEYGWQGSIRTLEVTYGLNGWHPHCHDLVFLSAHMTAPLANGLQLAIAELWTEALRRAGATASLERGVNVEIADAKIAEYVAKWGREPNELIWGAADEMTRTANKRSSHDGLTPFQLLEAADVPADDESWLDEFKVARTPRKAGLLFQEYADVFKRRNQLTWSPGLRALLALPDELEDSEIVEAEPAAPVQLAELEASAWKRICQLDKRGELLRVASSGDRDVVLAYLSGFGIGPVDLSDLAARNATGPPG